MSKRGACCSSLNSSVFGTIAAPTEAQGSQSWGSRGLQALKCNPHFVDRLGASIADTHLMLPSCLLHYFSGDVTQDV